MGAFLEEAIPGLLGWGLLPLIFNIIAFAQYRKKQYNAARVCAIVALIIGLMLFVKPLAIMAGIIPYLSSSHFRIAARWDFLGALLQVIWAAYIISSVRFYRLVNNKDKHQSQDIDTDDNDLDDNVGEHKQIEDISDKEEKMYAMWAAMSKVMIENKWELSVDWDMARRVYGISVARKLYEMGGTMGTDLMNQFETVVALREFSVNQDVYKDVDAAFKAMEISESQLKEIETNLHSHTDDGYWENRLKQLKCGLKEMYVHIYDTKDELDELWHEYEHYYGKNVAKQMRSINELCPRWLMDRVKTGNDLGGRDVVAVKPTEWLVLFKKYKGELESATKEVSC